MAKNDNLTDYLTDLADGIRAKKGTTEPINPQDFRKEIESISGGGNGGGAEGQSPIIICITKENFFKVLAGDVPDDIPQEEFAEIMAALPSEIPMIGYRRSSYTNPDGATGLHAIQEAPNELQENWLTYQTLKSLAINYSQLTIDKRDRKIVEIWRMLATTREEAITCINQMFPEQITLEEFLA